MSVKPFSNLFRDVSSYSSQYQSGYIFVKVPGFKEFLVTNVGALDFFKKKVNVMTYFSDIAPLLHKSCLVHIG